MFPLVKVMKKNKRERDEDNVRHGDQYDTQLLWFLMRHMRNRRPQRVSARRPVLLHFIAFHCPFGASPT